MFHEVQIIGYVGREPELRYTTAGKAFCNFSVASSRNVGQGQKETTWFKVTTFDKTAEYCNEHLHKSMKVHVIGRLSCNEQGSPRVFQKQDGTWAATFEVVAEKFQILDWNDPQERPVQGAQAQYQPRQQAQGQQQAQQRQMPQQSAQYAQKPVQKPVQSVQSNYTEDIPW